jgi:chromosome segregation ATPase
MPDTLDSAGNAGADPIRPRSVKWGIALIGVVAVFGLISAIWERRDAAERFETLQGQLQAVSAARNDAEAQVAALKQRIASEGDLTQRLATLQSQIGEREAAIATLEQRQQSADAALAESVGQREGAEAALKQAQEARDAALAQRESLTRTEAALNEKIEQAYGRLKDVTRTVERQIAESQQLSNQLATQRNQAAETQKSLAALNERMAAKSEALKELEEMTNVATGNLRQTQQRLGDTNDELAQALDRLKTVQDRMTAQRAEVDALETKLAGLDTQRKELARIEQARATAHERLGELVNRLRERSEALDAFTTGLAGLQRTLATDTTAPDGNAANGPGTPRSPSAETGADPSDATGRAADPAGGGDGNAAQPATERKAPASVQ